MMKNRNKAKHRFGRYMYAIILLLLAVVLLTIVSHQWVIPDENSMKQRLTIMTYNTHCMGWQSKQQRTEMIEFILAQKADVVCLQEVNIYKKGDGMTTHELRQALSEYDYTYYDFKIWGGKTQFGNVVFSRYPLINKHTIPYESRSNITSCCDVILHSDTLRLMVNHLESYRFSSTDWTLDSLKGQTALKRKLSEGNHRRHEQAAAVKEAMNASPYPLVVVGDLNSLPLSWVYWRLRFGLKDCFLQGSRLSLGNTFVKHGLGVRIDYILCSRAITPIRCYVPHSDYSDHYPVVATIGW